MKRQELPLFIEGKPITFPSLRLWCEMCYPNDRLSALRSWEALSQENLAMQNGLQPRYSRVGELIQRDMVRAVNFGKLCGYVACQVRWNFENRGGAYLNQAVFLVSEFYSNQTTKNGRNIPTDGSRLRNNFSGKYRQTLHLWAAFSLLEEKQVAEKVLSGEKEFDELLVIAFDMQKFFERTDAIHDLNLLSIPDGYIENINRYNVSFPTEPDWVEKMLKGYDGGFSH